jgi:putative membrane protein
MKELFAIFLKGAAMGAANVIPGVSGGTVAFITGIYERLINALKNLDGGALKLLFAGCFRDLSAKIDFPFLAALGLGVVVSILTFAEILKYFFVNHAVYVWSFFFGLIVASVYFVGKQVKAWSLGTVFALLVGAAIAVGVALLKPASENDNVVYLFLCGIIAMASMIIPGISGSFVLLLLGNYQLIMIESVSKLKSLEPEAFSILIPVGAGAVFGMIVLSHFLAWIFRRFHNHAVSLLTGFVAGSLLVIWPWKEAIVSTFEAAGVVKEKVIGYDWFLPGAEMTTFIALGIMGLGVLLVWVMEKYGAVKEE